MDIKYKEKDMTTKKMLLWYWKKMENAKNIMIMEIYILKVNI